MSGQLHVPTALPPGEKPQYALNRRLGGSPEEIRTIWRSESLFTLPGLELDPSVQPAASRYTDYATAALVKCEPSVFSTLHFTYSYYRSSQCTRYAEAKDCSLVRDFPYDYFNTTC
jgi:hypothetical protein